MTNTEEAEMMQKLLMPVITKHGLDRGVKIMQAVVTVVEAMKAWPEDIRGDALETLLGTIDVVKKIASESEQPPSALEFEVAQ